MIAESNYIELMKNCSKWNTRIGTERRNRFRVPYFEQQTGTAHRLVPGYYKTKEQRYASDDPNVVAVYPSSRWRKRRSAPSDAIEMKMFLRDNPALDAAINSSAHHVAPVPEPTVGEVLTETLAIKSTTRAQATTFSATRFDEFGGDLDDEASNDDAGSDEEDWGSKRRGKQHHHAKAPPRRSTTSKKASVGVTRGSAANTRTTTTESTTNNNATTTTSVESQSDHSCPKCRAKYKSLAGLSYHNAYVHNQPLPNAVNKLLSPSVEASDFCDLCLGNRYMNKKTKQAEDLVTCHDCGRSGHPSCLQFNSNVSVVINRYGWQCIECKSCTCCALSDNDDQLLFCDDCDRGYHLYCLNPPLKEAPDTDYSCRLCQKEFGDKASAPAKE